MSANTRLRAVARAGAAAVLLSACSQLPQGDHRWIQNSKEGMFTRIPKDWTTHVYDPYLVDTERPAPLPRNTRAWTMLFDSTPRVKPPRTAAERKVDQTETNERLNSTFPTHLIGSMSIYPLSSDFASGSADEVTFAAEHGFKPGDSQRTFREALSIGLIRDYALFDLSDADREAAFDKIGSAGDPIKAFVDGNPSVEVVKYKELLGRKDGLWGVSLRLNYEVSPLKWTTIDQQILVNQDFTKVYRLVVKCESSCFKKNYREAKRIASNWRVKP